MLAMKSKESNSRFTVSKPRFDDGSNEHQADTLISHWLQMIAMLAGVGWYLVKIKFMTCIKPIRWANEEKPGSPSGRNSRMSYSCKDRGGGIFYRDG